MSLESELSDKEKAYISSPSPVLWKEMSALRSALDCLLTKEAEKRIQYTKQRFYEYDCSKMRCISSAIMASECAALLSPHLINQSAHGATL